MKRLTGPLLLAALILGVGSAIYFSARTQIQHWQVATVHGVIGADKESFFEDPRVVKALHDKGFDVAFDKAGSRSIATSYDLSQYDFAFTSGAPAAELIRSARPDAKTFDVFYTPMAIASWQPIAQILVENGMARDVGGYYTLDMDAFLKQVADGARWSDLKNSAAYPSTKSLLISTADVRASNSAAMYVALVSYVANHGSVVQSSAEAEALSPLLDTLFLKQGYTGYSSEEPFHDYLLMGPGKSPLVLIYESQWIAQAVNADSLSSQMVLMYPNPTLYSKHVLVALSPAGEQLGQLLQTDPTFQHLAVEYGFRTSDMAYFNQFTQDHGLKIANAPANVIDLPSTDFLEKMIQQIARQYQ